MIIVNIKFSIGDVAGIKLNSFVRITRIILKTIAVTTKPKTVFKTSSLFLLN